MSGKITNTDSVSFAGINTEIITGGENEKVTIMRMTVTPKFGAPQHISYDEDKVFLIVHGKLRFTVAGDAFDAQAGDYVAVKGGDVHGFVNLQQSDAVQLLVSSPARHDQFFRALAALPAPPDPAALEEVCRKYNQKIVGSLQVA
jgi:quercetin dioxygenase-like cupin family protein